MTDERPEWMVDTGLDVEEQDEDLAAGRTPVHTVMSSPPVVVEGDVTLRDVAEALAEENLGSVIVQGPEGTERIVTERDIAVALADGADPDTTQAWEMATEDPVGIDVDDTVLDAAVIMVNYGVRHLPVRDGARIVGVVSARDALSAFTVAFGTRR